jgi:hypothetical protein
MLLRMSRRFFFFPHGLESPEREDLKKGSTPSRVRFEVTGMLVTRTGVKESDGVVMADGYRLKGGDALIGGNQDPCIFSAPLGGVHAFNRILKRQGHDHDVVELSGKRKGLLTAVAAAGDVIFYGKPDMSADAIAVDTVLVVAEILPLAELASRVEKHTDAWAYSLSDAQPKGSEPGENAQMVIVGASTPALEAVDALTTSFVPLAGRDSDGRWQVLRLRRADIGETFDEMMETFKTKMFVGRGAIANKGRLVELSSAAGEALGRAAIARSRNTTTQGAVFVPPLRPRRPLPRFGADGTDREAADHLKWLDAP